MDFFRKEKEELRRKSRKWKERGKIHNQMKEKERGISDLNCDAENMVDVRVVWKSVTFFDIKKTTFYVDSSPF